MPRNAQKVFSIALITAFSIILVLLSLIFSRMGLPHGIGASILSLLVIGVFILALVGIFNSNDNGNQPKHTGEKPPRKTSPPA